MESYIEHPSAWNIQFVLQALNSLKFTPFIPRLKDVGFLANIITFLKASLRILLKRVIKVNYSARLEDD